MKKYNCDVLVIGAGGGALRAAIAAKEADKNLRVILVTKGKLGKSGVTATACSDRMAFHATLPFTKPGGKDNWKFHAADIYEIGGKVSDYDLAKILAKNSKNAFEYLDKLGVPFVKKNGKPEQFLTDGSEYPRACYTGPYTANDIENALIEKIKKMSLKILEETMIIQLVTFRGRIIGAFGLDTRERFPENLRIFNSKTIILATGGAGEIFKDNLFPGGMSGDGYALAYEAGAKLVNMEFIQFGLSSTKTKLALSGSMMRALPRIVNDKGEEILIDPNILFDKGASWPISYEKPSKIIDLAVFNEREKGRSVYLDYRKNPTGLKVKKLKKGIKDWYQEKGVDFKREKFKRNPWVRLSQINPAIVTWFREKGINLEKEKIEIAPAAQHFQGGVKIGAKAQTNIKGLYAVGECAGGQHGANRPGGNSLLDCQVFGKIAGDAAAKEAKSIRNPKEIPRSQIEEAKKKLRKLLNQRNGLRASLVRSKIQKTMSTLVSIVRTREGLTQAKKQLEAIEKKGVSVDKNGPVYLLETINILKVAKIITNAASLRDESRGPHLLFKNFPLTPPSPSWGRGYKVIKRDDKKWQKYIVVKKDE